MRNDAQTSSRSGWKRFSHKGSRVRSGQFFTVLLIIAALFLSACEKQWRQSNTSAGQTSNMASAGEVVVADKARGVASNTTTIAPYPQMDEQESLPYNTEGYSHIDENPFLEVARAPLSTFSIDVDTASYSNTRRFLKDGHLPPKDAVRIEELVNYFSYDYPQPVGDAPFSVTAEIAEAPWDTQHRLVHIGLQGKRIPMGDMPPANLVFLIDVSGSMNDPRKLPLVKSAMKMLTEQLSARDRVAMVVYAGTSGLVLLRACLWSLRG